MHHRHGLAIDAAYVEGLSCRNVHNYSEFRRLISLRATDNGEENNSSSNRDNAPSAHDVPPYSSPRPHRACSPPFDDFQVHADGKMGAATMNGFGTSCSHPLIKDCIA